MPHEFREPADEILAELTALRASDAPTHGGTVLSYVYDSGRADLDDLAAAAIRLMQPVNGLDPTTFTSVPALEREVVGFVRDLVHGGSEVVGAVTTGGTESCLLAVKTARDLWREGGGDGVPQLVMPVTAHAAFHKAAHYFGLEPVLIGVDPQTGAVDAADMIAAIGPQVALVVLSAPNYPFGGLDPVADVAPVASAAGVSVHVDACIGGMALPFVDDLPAWDFRVAGVTSLSVDLHKYGFAPKGASVLLHSSHERLAAQYFATTRWPGYPVVNPTMIGSRSAGPLAAAWAIIRALRVEGFIELGAQSNAATAALVDLVGQIVGLRVVGSPAGPLFAVATDDSVAEDQRVDPHHWADAAFRRGWQLQLQPAFTQDDGRVLPHTTHLTVTPVTLSRIPELTVALREAADEVRGLPSARQSLPAEITEHPEALASVPLQQIIAQLGLTTGDSALPTELSGLLAMIETLPREVTERLLVELLSSLVDPTT